MGEFNPTAALLIIVFASFFMALVFFANSILINIKSEEEGWAKESRIACAWGLAFMFLGHLGNHFVAG